MNRSLSLVTIFFAVTVVAVVGPGQLRACTEDSQTLAFRTCLQGTATSCAIATTGTHVVCSTLTINNSASSAESVG